MRRLLSSEHGGGGGGREEGERRSEERGPSGRSLPPSRVMRSYETMTGEV